MKGDTLDRVIEFDEHVWTGKFARAPASICSKCELGKVSKVASWTLG